MSPRDVASLVLFAVLVLCQLISLKVIGKAKVLPAVLIINTGAASLSIAWLSSFDKGSGSYLSLLLPVVQSCLTNSFFGLYFKKSLSQSDSGNELVS